MSVGKLNVFQRTALVWNEALPYNAIHVVRLEGRPELERLKSCLETCLGHYGLGGYRLDPRQNTYRYEAPGHVVIQKIASRGGALEALRSHMESELNAPFALDGVWLPLRFFVVEDDGSFYLGITYFHVIADAHSIIRFFKDLLAMYSQSVPSSALPRPALYPHRFESSLWRRREWGAWLRSFGEDVSDVKQSFRLRPVERLPEKIGLLMKRLDGSIHRRALEKARQDGVTLNDVFMAALLRTLGEVFPNRAALRRKKLAVSSIASLRRDLGLAPEKEFGLFLSSFRVSHAAPETADFAQLLGEVGRQSGRAKKSRLYLRNALEMRGALSLLRFYDKKRRQAFYAKYYPLAAGLTDLHLKSVWGGSAQDIDYLRAVSTSIATPLVFSVTSAKETHVTMSYSDPIYSPEKARRVFEGFFRCLEEYAG